MSDDRNFPTLRDFRDRLASLVDEGLGDLPAQILVLPDSTMQALACHFDPTRKLGTSPALMIDLDNGDAGKRLPVSVLNVDRMSGSAMPTPRRQ